MIWHVKSLYMVSWNEMAYVSNFKLRLEVMFDEGSEVFYRGIKPRLFLVFQICFVD